MSLKIKLDHRTSFGSNYYTNLDQISGVVELELSSSENVSTVVVKLQGLSKSTCYKDPGNGKTRSHVPVQELHRVLYVDQVVFPSSVVQNSASATSFTLPQGRHSWPFSFRIPVNNDCKEDVKKLGALSALISGPPNTLPVRHVQQILPPSMIGSEEIWVRYYIKVTVNRPSMLSLNHREYKPFIFLPIEPPRAAQDSSSSIFFVKRMHTLSYVNDARRTKGLRSIFSERSRPQGDSLMMEMRTPNPPSITPGLPMALELYGSLESNINQNRVKLIRITAYLLVTTRVKAQYLKRTLASRLMCYKMDTDIQFTSSPEQDGKPTLKLSLPRDLEPLTILNDTPPTFETCNIARSYELEVVLTLANTGNSVVTKDMLSLTVPILVRSGVSAPPPQEVMAPGFPNSLVAQEDRLQDETDLDPLPSYKQVVRSSAPSAAPRQSLGSSAIGRRTSYRIGEDYFVSPTRQQQDH